MPDLSSSTADIPLWRLSLRRLRRRPLQTILLVLGVAIGVAMMVSIDLANGSARRAFELSTDAVTGRTTHRIIPSRANDLDEAVYFDLRRELGQEPLVMDDLAGLARVALAGGDPTMARSHVDEILARIEANGTAGIVNIRCRCY